MPDREAIDLWFGREEIDWRDDDTEDNDSEEDEDAS